MLRKLPMQALAFSLIASRRLGDVAFAAQQALEEVALHTLTDAELRNLTVACYRHFPTRRKALFDWEQAWFERDLPPPPARLLLGGAGAGRELQALRHAGYDLCAFDPVRQQDATILQLDYQGWVSPREGEQQQAAQAVSAGAPYDAIVFGWGSFTHIPAAEMRLQVLQMARRHCRGPLLLSFWQRGEGAEGEPAPRLGKRIGSRMVRLLGGGQRVPRPGDLVVPHAGYVHAFTGDEIDALADAAGYRIERSARPYPHATLWPRAGA